MPIFATALSLLTGTPIIPGQSSPKQRSFMKRYPKQPSLKGLSERELIELESEIGRQLFGPIPAGHRRDFFCLDENTWVWHEEWVDTETGKKKSSTTRYEAHANGVLKAQDGLNYSFIEGEELINLAVAVRLYYEQVMRGVYQRDPITGHKLAMTPPATI